MRAVKTRAMCEMVETRRVHLSVASEAERRHHPPSQYRAAGATRKRTHARARDEHRLAIQTSKRAADSPRCVPETASSGSHSRPLGREPAGRSRPGLGDKSIPGPGRWEGGCSRASGVSGTLTGVCVFVFGPLLPQRPLRLDQPTATPALRVDAEPAGGFPSPAAAEGKQSQRGAQWRSPGALVQGVQYRLLLLLLFLLPKPQQHRSVDVQAPLQAKPNI